jgi:ketosteroid isomerase-like protein
MAVASKVAGPRAVFRPLQRTRTSRCALLAAAAAASWVWHAAPALAQGAPKVRIITGNGDFLVDMRPAAATPIGAAADPQPTAPIEQTSAAGLSALPTTTTTTTTPNPAPSQVPLLAQEPATAPAPTAEVALSATQAAPAVPPPTAVADMAAAPNAAESTAESVQAAVRAWASAWAGKDLNAYFASYGQGFAPAGNQARKSWETSRRQRIAGKPQISVTLSDLMVVVQGGVKGDVKGDVATARFKQHYSAGALNISSRKILELTREANERWVISKETAGR